MTWHSSVDVLIHECRLLLPTSSEAGICRMIQWKPLASEEASYSNDAASKKEQRCATGCQQSHTASS
jgi:hypothetical protein